MGKLYTLITEARNAGAMGSYDFSTVHCTFMVTAFPLRKKPALVLKSAWQLVSGGKGNGNNGVSVNHLQELGDSMHACSRAVKQPKRCAFDIGEGAACRIQRSFHLDGMMRI